jgi:la-related protein 4
VATKDVEDTTVVPEEPETKLGMCLLHVVRRVLSLTCELAEGAALTAAIKKQVEYYFSKANLEKDAFLVSQMDSQMYVLVAVIAQFAKVKALSEDEALIVEAVTNSTLCSLNPTKTAIKPNIKAQRNTIILRDIPSDTSEDEVREIFSGDGCKKVVNVHSDVGDTWFVTMDNEQDAVDTLLHLKLTGKKFNGNSLKARLKSENILRSFFPVPAAGGGAAQAEATPANFIGAAGGPSYYGGAPGGAYFQSGGGGAAGAGTQYAQSAYGQQNGGRMYKGGTGGAPMYEGYGYGEGYGKGGARSQKGGGRGKGEGADGRYGRGKGEGKGKGAGIGQPGAAGVYSPTREGRGKGAGGRGGREVEVARPKQPVFSSANFPELNPGKVTLQTIPGWQGEYVKYSEEDVLQFASHMSEDDWKLPKHGLQDLLAEFPDVLTVDAHPELLRRQRTVSIEQARAAIRHGKPAQGYNDGEAIGQDEYHSMLYGESAVSGKDTQPEAVKPEPAVIKTKSVKEDKAKSVGYAAALLKGPKPTPKPAAKPKATAPPAKPAKAKDQPDNKERKETASKDSSETKEQKAAAAKTADAGKRGWEMPGVKKVVAKTVESTDDDAAPATEVNS